MDALKILVIEDNADLLANIFEYFESRGHIMDAAPDGLTGLHLAACNNYDVIILDLMLPGLGGIELCRKLRHDGKISTPIIMLTARDALDDKLLGFEVGADDYLVKPFALPELEARSYSLRRRCSNSSLQSVLCVGDLRFDTETRTVQRQGRILELTPITRNILALLMKRSPALVRHEDIEQTVWGDTPTDKMVLRAHMSALRAAIDRPFEKKLLKTVHREGYRLDASEEAS